MAASSETKSSAIDGGSPFTTFTVEMFPSRTCHVALFQHVTNGADVMAAVKKQAVNAALLNPHMVHSIQILKLAAAKAIYNDTHKRLASNSIHTEVIYSLSPETNIAAALRKFGIAATSEQMLVLAVDASPSDLQAVVDLITGEPVPIQQVDSKSEKDLAALRKLYKVAPEEIALSTLEDAISSRLAGRDI